MFTVKPNHYLNDNVVDNTTEPPFHRSFVYGSFISSKATDRATSFDSSWYYKWSQWKRLTALLTLKIRVEKLEKRGSLK